MNMLRMATATAALGLCVIAAHAASGVVVAKSAEVKGKAAADLVAKFGAFCAIKDWHPAVAECAETKEGNTTFRTLTLKDGGKIKEKLSSMNESGYNYTIIESPLPVKDYMATFSIKDEGGNAKISWVASFQPKGKPEPEAKQVIEGIFDAGLKSLSEKAAE